MILIFSTTNDISTSKVCNYLSCSSYIIINVDYVQQFPNVNIGLSKSDLQFTVNGRRPSFVWFRKNFREEYLDAIPKFSGMSISERLFLKREWRKIFDNIRFVVDAIGIPSLGSSKYTTQSNVDKLEVLYVASKMGLNIPESFLVNDIASLDLCKPLITKPIGEFSFMVQGEEVKGPYTTIVEQHHFEDIKDMSMSFFQRAIESIGDVRVFYLDGEMLSGVMLRKPDANSVDYRLSQSKKIASNWKNITLSMELKKDIERLMKNLSMNFGLIDFVLTKDGRFFFLEINVGGQFGDLGLACNFNLEKKIANYIESKI